MTSTESISPRYAGLDAWDDEAILDAFVEGQARAIEAVGAARPALAKAARAIAARTGDSGRIVYVGAGSSGLIAALDGMELGGTFGWPDERTVLLLASGPQLQPGMRNSAEDDAELGRAQMLALKPRAADAVIGVAASGTTRFTLAAIGAARNAGALTIGLANNREAPLLRAVEVPVFLDSGPEIIVGSTRMGAGTAQKAALGLISSLAMIRLGHIYDGLMVNLRIDNAKLRKRALTTLATITGAGEAEAEAALDRAGGKVKAAALLLRGLDLAEAEGTLNAANGNLRTALASLNELVLSKKPPEMPAKRRGSRR